MPAIVVAVTPPDSFRAADTADGQKRTDVTLRELVRSLVNLSLDHTVRVTMNMVMGTMLRCDANLKKREETEEHGHHALGLAEIGHAEC